MNLLRLILLLAFCCFLGAAQELSTVSTEHPEQIGGRWETTTSNGVEGIGFEISTSSKGPIGSEKEQFDWQDVSIRVYTREDGKETWGYFAARYKAAPHLYDDILEGHSFDLFDGRRLRAHSAEVSGLKQFDLDITFLPGRNKWMGTWSRPGKNEYVTLARPEPKDDAKLSRFAGQWIGEPGPNSPNGSDRTTLNIRQSADGVITASLDRTSSWTEFGSGAIRNDRSDGQQLNIESATDATLVLSRYSAAAPNLQYRAELSPDGQMLTGSWSVLGGGGPRLNIADQFRRASATTGPQPAAR